MTRAAFIALLRRLRARGVMTTDEVEAALAGFDAGTFDEGDLPLEAARLVIDVTAASLVASLARTLGKAGLDVTPRSALDVVSSASFQQRERLATRIMTLFSEEARRRTTVTMLKPEGLRRWHTAMQQALRDDLGALAQLGKGGLLSEAERRLVEATMRRELAYLQRFAEEIAGRQITAAPMSAEQIVARLDQYKGSMRAAFYDEAARSQVEGVVVYYIPLDDRYTCDPCSQAGSQGPYLPGEGHPLPGDVCLGRGHCRCRLEFREEPEAYRRLINQRRAA